MTNKTFEHTHFHSFRWESDLVYSLYYNENTWELLVDLVGGKHYKYGAVTPDKFEEFKNAGSPGSFYNNFIKRDHKVASLGFFGYGGNINFVDLRLAKKQFEVTVQVTVTTTVKVSAENFDSAAKNAVDEVKKIQGMESVVGVLGVKKI